MYLPFALLLLSIIHIANALVVLSKENNFNVTLMSTSPFSNKPNSFTMKLKSVADSPEFCPDTNVELDRGAIIVITVCGVLLGLVTVGTTVNFLLCSFTSNKLPSKLNIETESLQATTNKREKTVNNNARPQLDQSKVKEFMLLFSLYNTIPRLVSTKQSMTNIKGLNALKVFNILIVINHVQVFATSIFTFSSQNTEKLF